MKITDLLESNNEEFPFKQNFSRPLFHGSNAIAEGDYQFKMREKSRDTFGPAHRELSKLSKEKFGIDIRSLLFTSFDRSEAKHYGDVKEIIPFGNDYRLFAETDTIDLTWELGLGRRKVALQLSTIIDDMGVATDDVEELRQNILFYYNDPDKYQGALDEFFNDFTKEVIECFKAYGNEFDEILIKRQIGDYRSELLSKVHGYIDDVREIFKQDDLPNLDSEIMLYAPSGFRLKEINEGHGS